MVQKQIAYKLYHLKVFGLPTSDEMEKLYVWGVLCCEADFVVANIREATKMAITAFGSHERKENTAPLKNSRLNLTRPSNQRLEFRFTEGKVCDSFRKLVAIPVF
jgi:hypothetical protein